METYLKVKVHADEKKEKLIQKSADTFEVWVKAPAERGLVTDVRRAVLGATLGVAENKLSLIKGATSPAKIFLLRK